MFSSSVGDSSVCVCLSLYWLITHVVEYNVSISGTVSSLVLHWVIPGSIFPYCKKMLCIQRSTVIAWGLKASERTMKSEWQVAQKIRKPLDDEDLWYLNFYVGFLKTCFHLVITMRIFRRKLDFKYKTGCWLQPRSAHLASSVLIPANVQRIFASHFSGPCLTWVFRGYLYSISHFCCNFLHKTVWSNVPTFEW